MYKYPLFNKFVFCSSPFKIMDVFCVYRCASVPIEKFQNRNSSREASTSGKYSGKGKKTMNSLGHKMSEFLLCLRFTLWKLLVIIRLFDIANKDSFSAEKFIFSFSKRSKPQKDSFAQALFAKSDMIRKSDNLLTRCTNSNFIEKKKKLVSRRNHVKLTHLR